MHARVGGALVGKGQRTEQSQALPPQATFASLHHRDRHDSRASPSIWSDSVLEFQGEEDLIRQAHSELSISATGMGYGLRLFRRPDYIQEVMLDTTVDSEDIGTGWDYSRLDDRFRLVQTFARRLFHEDRREMGVFCSKFGPTDYRKAFRTRGLLSLEILETLREDIGRILRESSPQASDFVHEHLAVYDDLIIQARNAESELHLKLRRGEA